ncbi:DUF1801 domain-containing protein [Paenibacillus gorillae]|uniref:DUF1801 domain-containing protein n=1 Tax=Paenibacillus gorillae TaxID=1243662 RepID=UPI0004B2F955|nr:DUF1801 domain-containing protein [Paenibacillus gorillae]
MNQEVTDFINAVEQPWQVEVCNRLRQLIHEQVPSIEERIQYRKPHFLKNGKYAAVVAPAKGWVSFAIFNASELHPPDGLFEDGPPERRTVKIREKDAVDYDLLAELFKQASGPL